MPTRIADPFSPRGPLTSEQIQRYAQGEGSPAERHEVELHAESDPLVREAIDGLWMPGAPKALADLRKHRPAKGRASGWLIAGGVLIVIVGLGWTFLRSDPSAMDATSRPIIGAKNEPGRSIVHATLPDTQRLALKVELAKGRALPKDEQAGHQGAEHFMAAHAAAPVRNDPEPVPAPIASLAVEVRPDHSTDAPTSLAPPRSSRKLLFLHDLELVDPSELYPTDPRLVMNEHAVDARFADAAERDHTTDEQVTAGYSDFMEQAMAKFAQGDRLGCLEDLMFLLDQFPDDVNALFYAGLCAYDLGSFARAERYLDRVQHHTIDTYHEEAAWYYAQCIERSRGPVAARELFDRIAKANGFYAVKAQDKLIDRK